MDDSHSTLDDVDNILSFECATSLVTFSKSPKYLAWRVASSIKGENFLLLGFGETTMTCIGIVD